MRRGEIAGLRWGDWNAGLHQLSISRTRQALAGRSTEFATKTRTSRRCLELDINTERVLERWCDRQRRDGHRVGTRDPMFTNTEGDTNRFIRSRSASCSPGSLRVRVCLTFGPRFAPHPCQPARRGRHPCQSRLRTTRPRPPFVHDPHLPTPAPRHECRSRQAAHRFADLIKPVDDNHPHTDRETPAHRLCGRRTADVTSTGPVDEPGRRPRQSKTGNARKHNVSGHFIE